MLTELPLHHIGVATKSIAWELPYFEALGYRACSEYFIDPGQKVRGLFIEAAGQPTLELLENLEESGPLDTCLKHGVKFYHFAYLTGDMKNACTGMTRCCKAKMIARPQRAACFKAICFFMLPNMMLVELVQQ